MLFLTRAFLQRWLVGTAVYDCLADSFFVSIGGRCVDQPIACLNDLHNGFFARLGIRHTEYTVADLRHGDSVI